MRWRFIGRTFHARSFGELLIYLAVIAAIILLCVLWSCRRERRLKARLARESASAVSPAFQPWPAQAVPAWSARPAPAWTAPAPVAQEGWSNVPAGWPRR